MIIYLAVNKSTQKAYVGQTSKTLSKRMRQHAKDGISPFASSVKKRGIDGFDWAILESCSSKHHMDECERKWIALIGCKSPVGYNLTDGGYGTLGIKRSEAWIAGLSKRMSGDKNYWAKNPQLRVGKGNPNFGNHKPWSAARRAAMGTGPHPSTRPEVRQRISEGKRAGWAKKPADSPDRDNSRKVGAEAFKDPNVRVRHQDAVRAYHQERVRLGIKGPNAGIKLSDERKRQISQSTRAAMRSPEVQAKIRRPRTRQKSVEVAGSE